jgi:predicted AAA+ superfamily ATPase
LYFYDTGLAANLLGIRQAEDLQYHSYRGPLFENLVITELLKNRYNMGEKSNLYYFKDSIGNEIDIVIDEGQKLKAIEIKSGATLAGDYFKNLHYWQKVTNQTDGGVLYDGIKNESKHGGFYAWNWRKVADF